MEAAFDRNVLVVDDSPSFQKSLAEVLERSGYHVCCAASGEEALQLLVNNDYFIVITDVIMPGISGLNLLKHIKETSPDIDVVIVTSNASSFTAIKALRLGAYDFLVKPIDDGDILVNIVDRAREKRELTNENRRLINDLSEKNRALNEALSMMKTANRICSDISATLEAGEILKKLTENAVEQLKATKGYLLLLDKSGATFLMKISVGIDRTIAKNFQLRNDQGVSGLVASNNKPLRIGTEIPVALTNRILEEDENGELFTTPGILSIPLRIKDRVVGVLNISGRNNGEPFTDAEVHFLTILVNHAAIALDNAGSFYKLKRNGH